jgi:hypothetical protein
MCSLTMMMTCITVLLQAKGQRALTILCHIIIHTMSHHHTYYVTSSYILCHIIIHTIHTTGKRPAGADKTALVTSSYTCHIIIHMSHHLQAKGQRALTRPHLFPFSLRRVVLATNEITSEGFGIFAASVTVAHLHIECVLLL